MRACHFGAQNSPIGTNVKFFQKKHEDNFDIPFEPFIVQILKKSLKWILSSDGASFLAQNGAFSPNKIFLEKKH